MTQKLSRNAALYRWYVVCLNGFFWFPIFFLYFLERVSLAEALTLESIYYVTVVLAEVPSGWLSDKLGRRVALRAAMCAFVASYGTFVFGTEFWHLATAQVLLAAGYAFNSGTDTAFHYDSLTSCGLEDQFERREERIARLSFLVVGASAVVGGFVGAIELRWAYALSAVFAVGGLVITTAFEPTPPARDVPRFDRQVVACVKLLRNPALAWFFGFSVLLTVLIHIPYQLYQPYIDLLALPFEAHVATSVWTGVHAAGAMVIAAALTTQSVKLAHRLGVANLALLGLASTVAILALLGAFLHPLVVLALFFRSAPRALTAAPVNAFIVPRVGREMRASYLSLQSLAGRLCFSGLLLVLALFATTDDPRWTDISQMSWISAALGAFGIALLWVTRRAVSDTSPSALPPAPR